VLREGPAVLRERLQTAFADCGVEAELVLASGGEIPKRVKRAIEDWESGALHGIVIGGGDGSVGTVAGYLAGTGVPMGVLPLGTLNHFAKDLGMPLDLEAAVEAIAAGHVHEVDVGEVNGRVFVNNSLIGVYPYMVIDRERRRRRYKLGKWPAMGLAFLRMLWRFPRRRLAIEAEGLTRPYRTPCLFVGVNEYSIEMLALRRHRGLDGGRLWLFVAKQRNALSFLWMAIRVAFVGFNQARDFDELHVGEALVHTRASRVPVATDGEVQLMRGPLRYRVRPRDLRVLAPPGEDGS
jgi:diacylglycerol kinase family enzyme